nr:MAG TPA: hypothetical protein [Caudoviricetes sp.]
MIPLVSLKKFISGGKSDFLQYYAKELFALGLTTRGFLFKSVLCYTR